MRAILANNGPFALCHEGIKKYAELSEFHLVVAYIDPLGIITPWQHDSSNPYHSLYYKDFIGDETVFNPFEIERTDPILIHIYEELGEDISVTDQGEIKKVHTVNVRNDDWEIAILNNKEMIVYN